LGFELIDNQHKLLINMINELSIALTYVQPNSVLLSLVDRLQAYADSHFKAEEALFTTFEYSGRTEHIADHASFIDSIKYIRRQCELIDSPMSARIRDFLLNWLVNHIKTKDLEYKSFIDKSTV
jgi:hemerythrin-like metal-binding protein